MNTASLGENSVDANRGFSSIASEIVFEILLLLYPPEREWRKFACCCKRFSELTADERAWHRVTLLSWPPAIIEQAKAFGRWRAIYEHLLSRPYAEAYRLCHEFGALAARLRHWRWWLHLELIEGEANSVGGMGGIDGDTGADRNDESRAQSKSLNLSVELLPGAGRIQFHAQSLTLMHSSADLDIMSRCGSVARCTFEAVPESRPGITMCSCDLNADSVRPLLFTQLLPQRLRAFSCTDYNLRQNDEQLFMIQSHRTGAYIYRDEDRLLPESASRTASQPDPFVVVGYIHALELMQAAAPKAKLPRWHMHHTLTRYQEPSLAADHKQGRCDWPAPAHFPEHICVHLNAHTMDGRSLGSIDAELELRSREIDESMFHAMRFESRSETVHNSTIAPLEGEIAVSGTYLADFVVFDRGSTAAGVWIAECGLEVWVEELDFDDWGNGQRRKLTIPFILPIHTRSQAPLLDGSNAIVLEVDYTNPNPSASLSLLLKFGDGDGA